MSRKKPKSLAAKMRAKHTSFDINSAQIETDLSSVSPAIDLDNEGTSSAIERLNIVPKPNRKSRSRRSASYRPGRHFKRVAPRLAPAPYLDVGSAPKTQAAEVKNLWGCDTEKKIRELIKRWNRKFRRKWRASIKRRVLNPEMRAMIELLLATNKATTTPIMANTKVGQMAWKYLHERLVTEVAQNPEIEMALVTIISGDWATSHTKPVIELHHSQARMQRTLRAMAPNFFGVTELALFNSHPHPDGGQVVQGHGHALIWGADILRTAQKVATKHMSKFTPNITGAPQIDVRRVKTDSVNIARVCVYLFKPPHRCKTWCPPRGEKKGFMHESEKGDRFLRFLRMAEFRSLLTFEDICFSSGVGITIKKDLRTLLRATCEADAGGIRRAIHPDAIASFWAQVAKALGKGEWSVPIIARRK